MRPVVQKAIEATDIGEWLAEEAAEEVAKRRREEANRRVGARHLVQTPKRVPITTPDSPVTITVKPDSFLASIFACAGT